MECQSLAYVFLKSVPILSFPQSSRFSIFSFIFTFTPCHPMHLSEIIDLLEVKKLKVLFFRNFCILRIFQISFCFYSSFFLLHCIFLAFCFCFPLHFIVTERTKRNTLAIGDKIAETGDKAG